MKCQILFSGKNKKNIINLLSVELTERVVKVKIGRNSTNYILLNIHSGRYREHFEENSSYFCPKTYFL